MMDKPQAENLSDRKTPGQRAGPQSPGTTTEDSDYTIHKVSRVCRFCQPTESLIHWTH